MGQSGRRQPAPQRTNGLAQGLWAVFSGAGGGGGQSIPRIRLQPRIVGPPERQRGTLCPLQSANPGNMTVRRVEQCKGPARTTCDCSATRGGAGGGGGWHEALVLVCLPLAAPIGLSPLLILTLCGPERVLVVSTEPPDDLSCWLSRRRAVDQVHPDAHTESLRGFALPTPTLT